MRSLRNISRRRMIDVSYYCPVCIVNWAPKHTRGGQCVLCGGGTRRVQEPVSGEAAHLYLLTLAVEAREQRSIRLRLEFEEYCRDRDARVQPTEPIDSVTIALEAAYLEPAVEPDRWWST